MESPESKSGKENRVAHQPFTTPTRDATYNPNSNVNRERQRIMSDSKFEHVLRSPIMSEPSAALNHHAGLKFHDVFQMKQGRYADLPAAKISEMMTSNGLDNAPTQSLLSVVNGILDEGIERKNGEIPQRIALLLRKVVQEIERRISTQAEHLRTQNNLFKAREEKYQSRIKVLEALASNMCGQTEMEKVKIEENRKLEDEIARVTVEKQRHNAEVEALKKEMEMERKSYNLHCLQVETEAKRLKIDLEEKIKELEQQLADSRNKDIKEKDSYTMEISTLKQALEMSKKENELLTRQMETEAKRSRIDLEEKIKELEQQLAETRNKDSKEKNSSSTEISTLKQALEMSKKENELLTMQMETEAKRSRMDLEEIIKELEQQLVETRNKDSKEKDSSSTEISTLKQALEMSKKENELLTMQMETEAKRSRIDLEEKIKDLEQQLAEMRNKDSKEKDNSSTEILTLKRALEMSKKTNELLTMQMETEEKRLKVSFEERIKELEQQLADFKNKDNKEKDSSSSEISTLKQSLEMSKKANDLLALQMEMEAKRSKVAFEEQVKELEQRLTESMNKDIKEKDSSVMEISRLKQDLEMSKKENEIVALQMETEMKRSKVAYEEKVKELEQQLADSRNKEIREKDSSSTEISTMKRELEASKKAYELLRLQMEDEAKTSKDSFEKQVKELEQRLTVLRNKEIKEKESSSEEITRINQELEASKKANEHLALQMETEEKRLKDSFEEQVKELEKQLAESRNKEIEAKDASSMEISSLKQAFETSKKENELFAMQMEAEARRSKAAFEGRVKELEQQLVESRNNWMKEKDSRATEISLLMKELETTRSTNELRVLQLEKEASMSKTASEAKINKLEQQLVDSRNKLTELKESIEMKNEMWAKKTQNYRRIVEVQIIALRELRSSSQSVKQEVRKTKETYSEQFNHFRAQLKPLADVAQNYHALLGENRKLFNEIQELKGNIRVYCRVRPFLPGQKEKQSIVDHVGDDGEIVIMNPAKPGKDGRRVFKFNKVFGPASTQGEVYSNVQPFIRSVLDGYNACIFAYGQTGSGKTYTMTGPDGATKESWGVNYRALNDLFEISEKRKSSILYEITVQMIEIYNEQVQDLLSSDGAKKKLGVSLVGQSSGLAVPDASMHLVKAPSDVMDLIELGFNNRSVGETAMNKRSSRSHSIVSIHVRGTDLKSGTTSRGCLHLIDLAGSERVDRSEVTGDRLKEAQHINKSLSALGDVIFALSQKSAHVPYRNSKLTQILQSSLGGQAKTLMFVQLNPDTSSYSESSSTLKFAERVSGIELGAAKSSKDGKDVRDLMEQVSSLKDTIAKRDEEIERLQLLKDLKNVYPSVISDKLSESDASCSAEEQANASVYDNGDRDYDERTSNPSEPSTENSREGSERSDGLDRVRTASRVSRIAQKIGQNTSSPKGTTSIKKTPVSSSTLNKPPRPRT
ncbi:hypothetical protein MLD38_023997 [Melastoma candidum]|uniref:Uncharacterized protein n=1 Tax=Melastoma candidum TaxID=119954 RepID=A0ACB9NRU2_9MYRT|nr:hypothetical protein MLD38_023997 [Melastoma candidum]